MATQAAGKPPDEGGEHGPVRPVHTWSRVGSPEDSDLMTQHEHLHLLRGGRAAQQQDQPKHLPEDQIQQPQRHDGDRAERRSAPLTAGQRRRATFWNPTGWPQTPCSEAVTRFSAPGGCRRRVELGRLAANELARGRVRVLGTHRH